MQSNQKQWEIPNCTSGISALYHRRNQKSLRPNRKLWMAIASHRSIFPIYRRKIFFVNKFTRRTYNSRLSIIYIVLVFWRKSKSNFYRIPSTTLLIKDTTKEIELEQKFTSPIKYRNEYRVLDISYISVRCCTDFQKEESISFDDYVYFFPFLLFRSVGRLRYEIRMIFTFVRLGNIFLLFIVSYFLLRCTTIGSVSPYVLYVYVGKTSSMSHRARYMIYYALWYPYATTV